MSISTSPRAALAACLLSLCALTSCRAHVAVDEPPPPTAPLDERAAAYERLRPNLVRTTTPNGWPGATEPRLLVLNDGSVVRDPLDLAPAVKPGSATLLYAQEARDLESTARILSGVSVGVASLGLLGELGALVATSALVDRDPGQISEAESWVLTAGVISAATALVGLVGVVPTSLIQLAADDARAIAFQTYDKDLRARLALVPKQRTLVEQWEGMRGDGRDLPEAALGTPPGPMAPSSVGVAP